VAQEDLESEKAIQGEFFNRELSWLSFARRVLAMAGDEDVPLLERVRFAGIVGMLHDEFAMKRISGVKRRVEKGSRRVSPGALTAEELFYAVRDELLDQDAILSRIIQDELRPLLAAEGLPIVDYEELGDEQQASLRDYFRDPCLEAQRRAGSQGGLVADGRDMGTVVFPDADVKVFLVADLEERARRRLLQQGEGAGRAERLAAEAQAIARRDAQDSERDLSPLRRADDAVEIDTTGLTFEEQVEAIVDRVRRLTL